MSKEQLVIIPKSWIKIEDNQSFKQINDQEFSGLFKGVVMDHNIEIYKVVNVNSDLKRDLFVIEEEKEYE